MVKKESNVYFGYREVKNEYFIKWENNRSEAYKEYRRKWEELPKKLIVPEFPMHLDIESTSNCNLRCPMCPRTIRVNAGTWRPNKNFDFELFKKIIDEGIKEGLYAINLNNLGEPLLHPYLPEMIKYAKSRGLLDVFFHTNGVLLTEEISRKLVKSGLDKLIISIDSPYREKYDKIRIGANYDRVIENIEKLNEIKKELNSFTPTTRINMIKFPDVGEKELDDSIELFLPLVDSIGFLDYVDPFKKIGKDIEFPKHYISNFICSQPLTRLTIWEDGRVFPCCIDPYGKCCLGDLNNNSLKEIWESKKLKAFRKKHFDGKFYEIDICRNCEAALDSDNYAKKILTSSSDNG
jgi:radical SAM protein with 4Fe4S-binding SPASM domain